MDTEPTRGQGFQREPTISGPSFLGIGAEPERKSSGYSYLLDYEEPSGHRGLWMFLVLVIVAVLIGLQFRSELRARAMPLYSAVRARVNPQPPAPQAAPAAPAASAPNSAAAPEPPAPAAQPPSSASGNETSANAGTPSGTGSQSQSAVSRPTPSKPDDRAAPAVEEKSAAAKAVPETKEEEAAPSKKPEKAAQSARASRPKPAEAPPEDNRLLVLAQKYIRGEGVRRDCTTGVAYLREAMKHPSAAAATQMGALYATGTCMPMDRVAAYRWFGSALQMTPNNPWLARERDELYAQMSSAERRRANGQ